MDGYAVQSADIHGASGATPVVLRVVATVAAGSATSRELQRGEAIRIMTGAPVPAGADSVVRVEDSDGGEDDVRIRSNRDALRNIRPRGEDVARGAVAVAAGTELHPAHIGMLVSVGQARVRVHRRPRVAVLASGDELVDVNRFDEVMSGARIVSSNSYTLEASVRRSGGTPLPLGVVGDDPVALKRSLARQESDLLLTTGGISVGAYDFTRQALMELGLRLQFWRVRIRPGAPLGFGRLNGTPWLGLPGNPVSAMVTFELFARPAIRKMLGHRALFRRPVRARVTETISISAPLTHFLRAELRIVSDGYVATLTGPQGSGLLSSMVKADALLIIPPDRTTVEAGELVDALLLRDDVLHSSEMPA